MSCGLTTRNEHTPEPTSEPEATEDEPDPTADPDNPCVARVLPTEPAPNCAYPVTPMAEPPRLPSVESLSQSDCQLRLGDPIPLPFSGERYGFSFDVNGDQIDDVFWAESGLRLAVSRVQDGELSYARVDCDLFGETSVQIPLARFFVRHLNGDASPDLVVGSNQGLFVEDVQDDIRVLVNLPAGFVDVGSPVWPGASSGATLLDVEVGDFDGDGACLADVALGYGRNFNLGEYENGVLVARMKGTWPDVWQDEDRWTSGPPGALNSEVDGESIAPFGKVAQAGDTPGSPLFMVLRSGSDVSVLPGFLAQWEGNDVTEELIDLHLGPDGGRWRGPFDAWVTPLGSIDRALVTPYQAIDSYPALAVFDLDDLGRGVVLEHPLRNSDFDSEGGGEPAGFVRAMLDVDGDGDLDFVERAGGGVDKALVIHRNDSGTFAEGVELMANHAIWAEHPFVAAGQARGALVVVLDPPSVRPLWCD